MSSLWACFSSCLYQEEGNGCHPGVHSSKESPTSTHGLFVTGREDVRQDEALLNSTSLRQKNWKNQQNADSVVRDSRVGIWLVTNFISSKIIAQLPFQQKTPKVTNIPSYCLLQMYPVCVRKPKTSQMASNFTKKNNILACPSKHSLEN